jgi:hypothetical protein
MMPLQPVVPAASFLPNASMTVVTPAAMTIVTPAEIAAIPANVENELGICQNS